MILLYSRWGNSDSNFSTSNNELWARFFKHSSILFIKIATKQNKLLLVHMNDKRAKNFTLFLLVFVGLSVLYFLISTSFDGYGILKNGKIDFAVTGQFGDFIGGFLGTIINSAVFYFLYLTLNEQRKSSLKQSFETKLYELIHLHRENINELKYNKYHKSKKETSESRKVFRVIVEEFLECYHEVKRFTKMYPEKQFIKPDYKSRLETIKKQNKCKGKIEDLAIIDIAYCFLYFGVSKESETVLSHKFYNRYDRQYTNQLKTFLQLKPKEELTDLFNEWKNFKNTDIKEMKRVFENVYFDSRIASHPSNQNRLKISKNLLAEKYYGGHQHRLGHYFRHLFQSYKFISSQSFLTPEEKYFYGKTLRAQLSTYEQFILFFNSLSSLGMKWEYMADVQNLSSDLKIDDFKLITRYNLIKNLPGSQYYGFKYRHYYRDVIYEYKDDITYVVT
jgi:hypothetical protein